MWASLKERGGVRAWVGLGAGLLSALAAGAAAQESFIEPPLPRPPAFEVTDTVGLLGPEEIDALVAPLALYPDALLAQVLVASTYPIDVIKAERFLARNASLDDKALADKAATEPWDPSIQVLAGAFPDLLRKMAEEIDWTETLGNAVLAQTDDVLAGIQRMRARAEAAGVLVSNEAQVVETEGENITIAPADPEVIYVPQYDPLTVYEPTYVPAVDNGVGDAIVTGGIIFGSALLLDEIFDDDDDWDDYWHGPPPFDWDDDAFYPGGDIEIDGDVNIDIDRDRIGDGEGPLADRDGAWEPDPERREAAREKLAARDPAGRRPGQEKLELRSGRADSGAVAKLEAAGAKRPQATMPSIGDSALKPRPGGRDAANRAGARGERSVSGDRSRASAGASPTVRQPKNVSRSKQAKPTVRKSSSSRSSALKRSSSGGKARAASSRGRGSARGGGGRRR
jgi:uncharacterized membrane protein YgcG